MKKLICAMIALVVMLALICTASAETIRAKPVTIDINCLEDRMVKTDIDYTPSVMSRSFSMRMPMLSSRM